MMRGQYVEIRACRELRFNGHVCLLCAIGRHRVSAVHSVLSKAGAYAGALAVQRRASRGGPARTTIVSDREVGPADAGSAGRVKLHRSSVLVPKRSAIERDEHPHACGLIRRIDLPPHLPGATQRDKRVAGVALGEQYRAPSVVSRGAQDRRVVVGGDLGELVRSVPRRRDVADGQHDLDKAGQQLRAPEPVRRLGDDAADRRLGRLGLALRQPEQREARLRVVAPLAYWSAAPASSSHARFVTSSASGQAPCSCRISARWTRHCPVKVTMSGCCSHHAASATVHSWARRRSDISWQASIMEQ